MRAQPATATLLLALASTVFAACGGGGGGTTPISTKTPVSSSRPSAPDSGAAAGPSKQAGSLPDPKTSAERHAAGRAARFVAPQADNSIPTFGSEADPHQRQLAETSLGAYLSARAKGEWATACRGLAASVREQVEELAGASKKTSCPAAYAALATSSPPQARANPLRGPLIALRRKADSGFALFLGPAEQQYVMPMASEAGNWRVTQLAPITYPLGSETPRPP